MIIVTNQWDAMIVSKTMLVGGSLSIILIDRCLCGLNTKFNAKDFRELEGQSENKFL